MEHSTLVVTVSLVGAFALTRLFRSTRNQLPLPPGPPKFPLVGNLFDMPTSHSGRVFHEWAKRYGSDIIHLDAPGMSILILDSYESAVDVLDKKSAVTSSRMYVPMASDLMGLQEWNLGLMPYGEAWRSQRKLFHQNLHEGASRLLRHQQQTSAFRLLANLLDTPDEFSHHIMHMAASTIISMAYGLQMKDKDDPILKQAELVNTKIVQAAALGKYLVNFFPFLKYVPAWVPGAGFKREALKFKQMAREFLDKPFQATKRMIAEGKAEPSFVSLALRSSSGENDPNTEKEVASVAGVMFTAGTDTTDALVNTLVYVMLLNPHAQKKVHEEIDRVIAPGHLPTFDDEDSLPYLTAVIMETIRWNPIAPFGIPHFMEEEGSYRGYRIPKNTLIIGNAWGMLYSEEIFDNPDKFIPERFLKDGALDPDIPDPRKIIFGFGRRVCPGRHLALSTAWIAAASLLATFDILPSPDDPEAATASVAGFDEASLVRHPKPFKCSIKPRSQKAVELIHTANLM